MSSPSSTMCRLCQGELTFYQQLNVLNKYNVHYFKCAKCQSLQTETPYWLDEAYHSNLARNDTGAIQRNLISLSASYPICKLFNLKNALDIGGGDGLLCRLLRDYGINAFIQDKYAQPTYAQAFTKPDFTKPDILTAFEVIEHFVNPSIEIESLFKQQPTVVLLSTQLFHNHDSNWWYLTPETGQHIFFYSRQAIQTIAHMYDYKVIIRGLYVMFVKETKLTLIKKLISHILLSKPMCWLNRSLILFLPATGAEKDNLKLIREQKKT